MRAAKILLLAAISFYGGSILFAQTWTQTSAPTNVWSVVACSADGSKIYACAGGSLLGLSQNAITPIYTSPDGGLTWSQTAAPSNYWASVVTSADGTKVAAVANNAGPLCTSSDGDLTWVTNLSPAKTWTAIACSSDGLHLFAATLQTSTLYSSTNFGTTWQTQQKGSIGGLASSADGSRLAAIITTSISISTNSGKTWSTNLYANPLYSIACSADGKVLVVTADFGRIFTSTNYGTSWITNNLSVPNGVLGGTWINAAVSADGSKIAAIGWRSSAGQFGYIYTTTNYGQTWISNSVPVSWWFGVCSSADGNKIMAASCGTNLSSIGMGSIWSSQTVSSPSLNLVPTNNNLALSWLIPSTNFVLQQSYDLANWSDVTNVPVLNLIKLKNQVTIPMSSDGSFYRLKTP